MGERWDAAVAVAGDGPPADLPAAVAEELIALWSDLSQAQLRAARQRWSMECDGLAVRIVLLTRLTTATPWQQIPASLLADGTYQGILQSAGVAFTPPATTGTGQVRPACPAIPATAEPAGPRAGLHQAAPGQSGRSASGNQSIHRNSSAV